MNKEPLPEQVQKQIEEKYTYEGVHMTLAHTNQRLREAAEWGARLMMPKWLGWEQKPEVNRMVLWLTEERDIIYGFLNVYGDTMKGSQGRWASKYNDVENPIVKWQYAPPTE